MRDDTADGSRLTADGEPRAQPGLLVVFSAGRRMSLPLPVTGALVLGRGADHAALLPDERLSRQHASVMLTEAGWTVRDFGSRNGTFVDGVKVQGSVVVAAPRVIRLADTLLVPVDDVVAAAGGSADAGKPVVGRHLRGALEAVGLAAATSHTLLIQGESGTGKELAARAYHDRGPRASGPFVAVNCAAIPEGLAERLLFGAKRGAYSGIAADAAGHLRTASGGVLFLDEVAELDLQVQAKILRAIETREVLPLGASQGEAVDLRVCVATHRDLRAAVAAGRFREDLYYRLAPPEVTLPPLRDRLDEITLHVLGEIARVSPALAPHVRLLEACLVRAWPGNVRELRREVHHAAARALADGSEKVRLEHISPNAGLGFGAAPVAAAAPPDAEQPPQSPPKRSYVRRGSLTREEIEEALVAAGGNVAVAARGLGLHRSQLYREMERWSLSPPAGKSGRA
jgi:transcriptional regulator with GAF, ATPase, and Fis domain